MYHTNRQSRIHPHQSASFETLKPVLLDLLNITDRELLKLYIDRAYTEWFKHRIDSED